MEFLDAKEKLPSPSGHDARSFASQDSEKSLPQLQRKLKSRHLQMIAIGGTIGTGLFIGSGGALAKSGPAGALIAYIFIGSVVYSVMMSLGEMATYIPVSGGFTSYASRFVDPSLGFAMSWLYWFSWAITFALELVATGLIINYWNNSLSIAIFISVFWVVITALNLFPVSWYGETEFWLSSAKVLTVLGFLVFAVCINAGAGQEGYIGFEYWKNPGAFAPYLLDASRPALAKFVGFWAVLIQAGFSYQGTELVGIAAGETENPRKNVPKAIKTTFYRILFFFVFTVFFIGILIPFDNPQLVSAASDASASPFVIAAKLAGVKVLPDILNAVLLTVVLSAANSNVYSGSRILVSLSQEKNAPAILKRTTQHGVPYVAVLATSIVGFLAFLNMSNSAGEVFEWLLNISAVAGFTAWATICLSHVRFLAALKAQGIDRDTRIPYKATLAPWYAYYALFFCILIIITQGFTAFIPWNITSFFVAYISLILFVGLYIVHKVFMWRTGRRIGWLSPDEVDLSTGCVEFDDTVWEEKVPTTWWEKFWRWVVG